MPKPPSEEHELDELPPMDGDDSDAGDEEDSSAEELDEDPDDDGDPLDDSTGEGDPLEEEIEASGAEGGWLEDDGDSDSLDIGSPDTFGTEEEGATLLEGAEEPDLVEDELTVDPEPGFRSSDTGEEGFEEDEEDLREEDLPRLDADPDDIQSGDDPDLLEGLPEEDASEEPRPPWDDRAWERVDVQSTNVLPVEVLAIGRDGLVAGGRHGLSRVAGASGGLVAVAALGLRGSLRAVALEGDWIFVSTPRAGVMVSDDAGKSFREANSLRPLLDVNETLVNLVSFAGNLWGRTSGGSVLFSGDRATSWTRVVSERHFDAIAADVALGDLVALTREETGTSISRGAGGRLVVSSAGPLPAGRIVSLAAYDGHLAVALSVGAFRLENGAWVRLDGTGGLTAMTFARGDGSLVIALCSEGEGRAWILEARARAPAFTVAEMGDGAGASANEESDGARVRAVCWDGDRGVLWAAGVFGLTALRPARR